MKIKFLLSGVALALFAACSTADFNVDDTLKYCDTQVHKTLNELKSPDGKIDYTMMPKNVLNGESKWNLKKVAKDEWTVGFWSGVLWYDYEATKDETIRKEAEKFTESLKFLSEIPAYDHDLGFLVFCSYGNGYRLTANEEYKKVILDTADTLATLYDPIVGTIMSWPRHKREFGGHNTIMDNMINLEMLFWASKNGGGKNLYDVAVSHADKTMANQFREDFSSYHVTIYDTISGECIKKKTHQGYADNSMWARGQAWAIYGYSMVYRETKDPKYLDFAEKVTKVYLDRLPEDYIPFWDFDAPNIPNAPKDASAACIVASALLEMSTYYPKKDNLGKLYKNMAEKMLISLSSEKYQSRDNNPSLLMHSTGHCPKNSEVDASIIYADYYYMEALLRLKKLNEGKSIY